MNILIFADLLQLPPVNNNKPLFSRISVYDAKRLRLGINGQSLWKVFEYDELIMNMRQKDIENYFEIQ